MTNTSRFQQLIEALRLGQNEFARAVGLTSTGVSKLVRGESEPRPKTLRKICEVFPQVNYQWLTTGEGPILLEEATQVPPAKTQPTPDSAILAELRELRKEFSNLLNVIASQQEMIRKHTGNRTKARGPFSFLDLVPPSVALRLSI